MISQRSTHYWLWFLLFGLISGLAQKGGFFSAPEFWVVTATGLVGVITGAGGMATRLSRPYDLAVGIIFTTIGLLGILHDFPSLSIGVLSGSTILGLNLALPYAAIHTVLGLTSLNHSFKPVATTPRVTISSPSTTAAS